MEGRTPLPQSTFNLMSSILGASVLGYPYCFATCGTLLATAMMLVSLAACRFSFQLLLYSSQLSSRRSYEELAEAALGPAGRHMVEVRRKRGRVASEGRVGACTSSGRGGAGAGGVAHGRGEPETGAGLGGRRMEKGGDAWSKCVGDERGSGWGQRGEVRGRMVEGRRQRQMGGGGEEGGR
eukprot:351203-Chlamydomonas_euryale.AAC.2